MLIKLSTAFFLDADGAEISAGQSYYERRAVLCHVGDFQSMTGPVKVTEAMLERVCNTHNSNWERLKQMIQGPVPLKECAPLQLDHSDSATVTVGRLVGKLEVADYLLSDGTTVKALFGTLRVLGAENIEKARDGRWIHLSIGCDFIAGKVREMTITPFPAAGGSSFLSNPGETMKNRQKLKAYLTGHKKMSDDDAESELKKCEADPKEHEKLTAESDKQDEEDDKKKKDELAAAESARVTKLAAVKTNVTQLASSFETSMKAAKLAAATGTIHTRLSKLRAQCKVTPAEIKKMDIVKLASSSQAEIDAAMQSYEAREPVIIPGQLGTIKALDLAKIGLKSADAKQKIDLENDMRKNMKSLAQPKEADAKAPTIPNLVALANLQIEDDLAPSQEDLQKEHDAIVKLMDTDLAQAKIRLKSWLAKVSMLTGTAEHADSGAEAAQTQITLLAQSIEAMQTHYNELQKHTMQLLAN